MSNQLATSLNSNIQNLRAVGDLKHRIWNIEQLNKLNLELELIDEAIKTYTDGGEPVAVAEYKLLREHTSMQLERIKECQYFYPRFEYSYKKNYPVDNSNLEQNCKSVGDLIG